MVTFGVNLYRKFGHYFYDSRHFLSFGHGRHHSCDYGQIFEDLCPRLGVVCYLFVNRMHWSRSPKRQEVKVTNQNGFQNLKFQSQGLGKK